MLAHVAGLPVEELLMAAPVMGAALTALVSHARGLGRSRG
jgi:hypothetical protein